MKTLVTHINPHLDDIAGIWLFKKFFTDFSDAKVDFINASLTAAKGDETEDRIYIGTGGGQYDEHKGDTEDCATSLVWKDILKKEIGPKNQEELNALEELVEWSRLIDLGRMPQQLYDDFTIQAFIRPKDNSADGSSKAVDLGSEILDRVLQVLIRKHKGEIDWQNHIEFESKFGKSYAILSNVIGRPFCKGKGGDLFLMVNPDDYSVQYFTPSMEIDLEPIYQKLKELDPKADWFLHQSHHMVLCGGGAKPVFEKSKLSFEQLIDVAKSV